MAKQQTNRPASASGNTNTPASSAARRTEPAPIRPTASTDSIFSEGKNEFIFGRTHFIYFGIGLALVLLGLGVMTGGQQPSPEVWDESIIYSPVRITLAPIMIVAGFVVVIMGIFKKA